MAMFLVQFRQIYHFSPMRKEQMSAVKANAMKTLSIATRMFVKSVVHIKSFNIRYSLTLFTARDFPTHSLQGVLVTNTP